MQIEYSGKTDVGKKRQKNEDTFAMDGELKLFMVADGMGGHLGGECASTLAVKTVEETMKLLDDDPEATLQESSQEMKPGDYKGYLAYAIKMASRRIFEKASGDKRLQGMGTTAVIMLFRKNKMYLANVGDSRGYLIRGDKIKRLTTDHSLIEEQIRAGILKPEEAKEHRLKNIITRSVGFQDDVEVDTDTRKVKVHDIYLLCSDGLYNMMEDHEIFDVIRHHGVRESCNHLIDIANSRGGEDNISVILVRVLSLSDAAEEEEEETAILG